jgi:hypothetical protein
MEKRRALPRWFQSVELDPGHRLVLWDGTQIRQAVEKLLPCDPSFEPCPMQAEAAVLQGGL